MHLVIGFGSFFDFCHLTQTPAVAPAPYDCTLGLHLRIALGAVIPILHPWLSLHCSWISHNSAYMTAMSPTKPHSLHKSK